MMKNRKLVLLVIPMLCVCLAIQGHAVTKEEIKNKLEDLYSEEQSLTKSINEVKVVIDEIKEGKCIMGVVTDYDGGKWSYTVFPIGREQFEKWVVINILTGKLTKEAAAKRIDQWVRFTKTYLESGQEHIKELEAKLEENKKWQLYYLDQLEKASEPAQAGQPGSAASTTTSSSTPDAVGPVWVLRETIDDPNKMTGKGSGGYTTWDKINRNFASGGGPDGRWKYTMTVSGIPPSELRPGVTFDMVMTVTAAGDKSVGLALGGGIKAGGMIIKWEPENQDGTGTAGHGWANDKFWSVPSSSGTAHISVTEASLGTTEVWISPFIGGVGGMAIYKYVKKGSSQQAKPSESIKIER